MIVVESILYNLGVVAVGFGIAFVGTKLDLLVGASRYHAIVAVIGGRLLIAAGFLRRLIGHCIASTSIECG